MGVRPCLTKGETDYVQYVDWKRGLRWSVNDLDSDNSKRALSGKMKRNRITSKRKLEIPLIPMVTETFSSVGTAFRDETFSLTFLDPLDGEQVTKEFYGSSIACATGADDGVDVWWSDGFLEITEV